MHISIGLTNYIPAVSPRVSFMGYGSIGFMYRQISVLGAENWTFNARMLPYFNCTDKQIELPVYSFIYILYLGQIWVWKDQDNI